MRMVRVREKVFRNISGFRLNVSFVDCTSVFVKSVLDASLIFTYILYNGYIGHADHVFHFYKYNLVRRLVMYGQVAQLTLEPNGLTAVTNYCNPYSCYFFFSSFFFVCCTSFPPLSFKQSLLRHSPSI